MTPGSRFFSSSLGSKILIAISGLGLFVYLVIHLAGNLLVFGGSAVFNEYAHRLISNPAVVPLEIALVLTFVVHVYKTVAMTLANRRARPVRYAHQSGAGGRSRKTLASSTMILTGIVLAAFVVVHVRAFRFGAYYEVAGTGMRDLYRLELEQFSNPLVVGFYAVCMILVAFHLWHGISSACQSLGADHPAYTPKLLALGKVAAVVIGGGFLAIPLFIFFTGGRP